MGVLIKDFPMYEIDEKGNIFSFHRMKVMKPSRLSSGYYTIELFNENGSKRFLVHRLVAEAFIPNPDNLPQVNHKDENKGNNSADNLEWCTAKYNQNYGTCQARRRAHTDYTKPIYKEIAYRLYEKNIKPVIQFEKNGSFIAEYASAQEAKRNTNINASHIAETCKGKRKSAGGYVWQYGKG